MKTIYLASGLLVAGLIGSVYNPGGTTTGGPPAAQQKTKAIPKKLTQGPVYESLSELCSAVEKDGHCTIFPRYSPLTAVIAFVPDPYLTRLRLQFDRSIEAITWGAQDARFSFRSQWIPWQVAEPAFATLRDQEQSEEEQKQLRQQPGLLVFSGAPTNLAVFLVGESPTNGFDTVQFQAALQRVQQLNASDAQPRRIRILGPCFSGTFAPLLSAITGYPEGSQLEFSIVSGTTNHTEAEESFSKAIRSASRNGWSFRSLSYQDSLRLDLLKAYLRELGSSPNRIAVLSEDETVFGEAGSAQAGLERARFRFPRGIAYLRNAYQTDPGMVALSIQDPTAPRRSLQLSLQTPEIGHDSVLEFGEQTPVSAEGQIRQITDALHHDRPSLAVVIATDILDTIFIGKFLKASAPDVRQVFMDSDVLLTRPNDYPSLNGGLQVASYPRFSARRKWARERLTPLPFSSEFEEGIYNAAAATLAAGDKLQDYRPLGKSAIDPPLWLTAISGGEDWPLAVLNDPPKDVSKRTLDQFLLKPPPAEPLPILSHEPPSRIWRNMFRLGFLLALAYSWFLWHAQSRKVVLSRDRLWSDLWLKPKEPGAFARAFYILCLTLSLAAFWLTIISSVIGYWRYSDNVSWLLLAGAAVPLALLVALAVWLTYQTISLDPPASRIPVAQHWQYQLLALAPWLLFAAFGWALALILTPGQYFKSFFYSYRSIEIGSGVSPALPLLFVFLGFACWSVVQLQRRVFAEERYQLLPSLTGNQIAGSIDVLALRVEEYLEATFPEPFPYTSLASLLLFWAAWRITYRHFQSLEGSAYDAYYSAAVATLVTLLFLSTWRFWVCWQRLQLLLEQLAVHPIRWALQELPGKEYSWSPIWQSSPRKRSYVVLSRIVDCLRERRLLSANFTTPEDRLVEQHAQQLLQFVARREREGSALYKNLQTALQNTAQDVVDELNQGAWIQGSSETLMKEDEEDRKRTILRPGDAGSGADQKPVTLAKEFIALRFLSFIRYAMLQLRNLLTFIMIGFVLLAISLGCYPFSSPHLLAWTLVGCLVLTGAPVVLAFLEMERNAVLSWLTDTKAGRVEKGAFLLRVISFGILPLLSVLASHFPSIGQYVFSWVQPVVKSFH